MKNDGLQWKLFYLWKINSKKKKKIDHKIPLYRFKLNSTKQWIAINYLSIANRSRKKKIDKIFVTHRFLK